MAVSFVEIRQKKLTVNNQLQNKRKKCYVKYLLKKTFSKIFNFFGVNNWTPIVITSRDMLLPSSLLLDPGALLVLM